jgi:hypothetical protein
MILSGLQVRFLNKYNHLISLTHLAALEARIAASYSMIQKSKRQIQTSGSFIKQQQQSLTRSNVTLSLARSC